LLALVPVLGCLLGRRVAGRLRVPHVLPGVALEHAVELAVARHLLGPVHVEGHHLGVRRLALCVLRRHLRLVDGVVELAVRVAVRVVERVVLADALGLVRPELQNDLVGRLLILEHAALLPSVHDVLGTLVLILARNRDDGAGEVLRRPRLSAEPTGPGHYLRPSFCCVMMRPLASPPWTMPCITGWLSGAETRGLAPPSLGPAPSMGGAMPWSPVSCELVSFCGVAEPRACRRASVPEAACCCACCSAPCGAWMPSDWSAPSNWAMTCTSAGKRVASVRSSRM